MAEPASSRTLATAREEWLADAQFRRLSPETLREYRRVTGRLHEHLQAQLGRPPLLADLTAAEARQWVARAPRPLKPASVAAYVRCLSAFARWCGREYGIGDPLAGLRPPRVVAEPLQLFEPHQLRALLDAAPLHLAYALTLLAETGLRVSEAIALQVRDVDDDWVRVQRGKGGRARKVPVSPLLRRATAIYLRSVGTDAAAPSHARLLVGSRGQPWTANALRLALRRLGRRAGIAGVRVSPHTFRHQFAHDVAFGGGSLLALRDALGHSSLAMVARYAVPDDAALSALPAERTPLQRLADAQPARRSRRVSGDESA